MTLALALAPALALTPDPTLTLTLPQGVAKEDVDFLAWKCPPGACDKRPARWITLEEQCRYRIIIHLPGVSDWLEHFKHQLSCGALNVFITEERESRRRDPRREAEFSPSLEPPLFEHFDWWAPLLRAGEHYVHVQVKRRKGRSPAVCEALQTALAALEKEPGRDRCIAKRGQQLARSLTMDRVYGYMGAVLRRAAAAQLPEVVSKQLEHLQGGASRSRNPLRKLISPTGTPNAATRVVTKRDLLRHVSDSTRPWIEHVFLPANAPHMNLTSRAAATSATNAAPSFTFKR